MLFLKKIIDFFFFFLIIRLLVVGDSNPKLLVELQGSWHHLKNLYKQKKQINIWKPYHIIWGTYISDNNT